MERLTTRSSPRWLRTTAILYLMVLLTLTHLPRLGPIPDIPGKDKTCHFLSYLVAGILMLAAFGRVGRFFRPAVLAAGLLVLGCLDEWTQPWVGRSCDFMDWLADAIGIAFVAVAFILCRHFFGRYRATV